MYLKAESQSSSSSYSGKPRRVVVRRRIQHPRFRLIVPSEAIEELRNGRVGDALFTPNESVLTELILFVKVCETPCMVKPILIKELDQKIPGETFMFFYTTKRCALNVMLFSLDLGELGKTLKIGQETFVDLDQILGQYVEVLRGNLNELFHFEVLHLTLRGSVVYICNAIKSAAALLICLEIPNSDIILRSFRGCS